MTRKTKIAFWVLSLLLVASLSLACFLFFKNISDANQSENVVSLLSSDHEEEIKEKQNEIALLTKEKEELNQKIGEYEKEIALFNQKDDLYASLDKQIEETKLLLADAEKQIDQLNEDLARLTGVVNIDMNAQRDLIGQIETLLEKERPKKITMVDIDTPENLEKPEEEREKKAVESEAKVALYYRDIERGYTYSYHAEDIFDSASVIKLPLALSYLEIAEEKGWDFSEVYSFDPEAEKIPEGSGVIRNEKEKKDYSHLELFDYMLRYSDNVAFTVLKDAYSYQPLSSFCYANGLRSMTQNGLSFLSASDAGKILLHTYNFFGTNEKYGELVKNAMSGSTQTVMIGFGVSPKKIAHKYGWDTDAYHDAAIVFDEHPYILVFMSDLQQGGNEVNAYIQKLARLIDRFHSNFYHS